VVGSLKLTTAVIIGSSSTRVFQLNNVNSLNSSCCKCVAPVRCIGLPDQDGISGIGQFASEIGQPNSDDGKT
jgi:hypothetical protein